ncbi:hypothetical protein [Glutamicibacter nicotianae]|uniref:hypothetical protein n=1 Tax=Glutamicibacter nicotianae TaxID=37929 RepID=UPI00255230BA|nr:hypothetical protein [Glutamicibacter nicotianae]WIV43984.1 hypothetical protein QQS42_17020 [Glutamicibacter nicotianae]
MVTWLGIKNSGKRSPNTQFFGLASRRSITIVLLTSIAVFSIVRFTLAYLMPWEYDKDIFLSVLPSTFGLIVTLLYITVLERIIRDRNLRQK